jgi:hypothetical protein
MLNLFENNSKAEKLDAQYRELLSQAYKLSTVNPEETDKKMDEANKVMEELENFQKNKLWVSINLNVHI